MALSNGFDMTRVMDALMPRLGWQQPTEAGKNIVDADNLESDSGRFFNDGSFHAAATVQNVIAVMDDPKASAAQINDELRNLKRAAINAALSAVFSKPRMIDRPTLMFDKAANTELRPVTNNGKFVGMQLKVPQGDWSVKIDNVALMFNADATLTLYLYHDLRVAPLWQKQVTVQANDQKIIDLGNEVDEVVLNYLTENNHGGVFYFGYFQDDLGEAQALDLNLTKYASYNMVRYDAFEATVIAPLQFQRYRYTGNYRTYGLNMAISSYYDYTANIISNAHLFDNLIGLQMAAQIIEEIVNTRRSNKDERIMGENAQALYTDLNAAVPIQGMPYAAQIPYSTGLRNKINREIKSIYNHFYPSKPIQSGRYADFEE